MKKTSELKQRGQSAVQGLHRLAKSGDHHAVEAIRDLALAAIATLDNLTAADPDSPDIPEEIRPGVNAVHAVARHSARWPIALHAVREIRNSALDRWQRLDVGAQLGIRREGKKRSFSYDAQVGLAADIYEEMRSIRAEFSGIDAGELLELIEDLRVCIATVESTECVDYLKTNLSRYRIAALAPLDSTSVSAWAELGVEVAREWCGGDWSAFPWPSCIQTKIGSTTDENGHERSVESSIRGKIFDGLKRLVP